MWGSRDSIASLLRFCVTQKALQLPIFVFSFRPCRQCRHVLQVFSQDACDYTGLMSLDTLENACLENVSQT